MKIKPKKSLGQNFLIDNNIIEKIVSTKEIKDFNVLEVGPGTGNLTQSILEKKPCQLIVVEKDKELSLSLKEKFKEKILIHNEDILEFDINKNLKGKFTVFGNLPYNISTEIICNWILKLNKSVIFTDLILMFQKEVAQRIIAKENSSNYGRLSIISNWMFDIKKIIDVSPNSFYPKPKIDSTVLHFSLKEKIYKLQNVKHLETITKIFFNQRRKMIKKPLKQLFEDYLNISGELKLDLNLRPQNLSPEVYYEISNIYSKLRS